MFFNFKKSITVAAALAIVSSMALSSPASAGTRSGGSGGSHSGGSGGSHSGGSGGSHASGGSGGARGGSPVSGGARGGSPVSAPRGGAPASAPRGNQTSNQRTGGYTPQAARPAQNQNNQRPAQQQQSQRQTQQNQRPTNNTTAQQSRNQNQNRNQQANQSAANRVHASNPAADKHLNGAKAIKENKNSYTVTKTDRQTGRDYKQVVDKKTGKVTQQINTKADGSKVAVYNKKDGTQTVARTMKDPATGRTYGTSVTKTGSGVRTITTQGRDGSITRVTQRNGVTSGYYQRSYSNGYATRVNYYGGRSYSYNYRSYNYYGHSFYGYSPYYGYNSYWYGGYMYNPWHPFFYSGWGWYNPWYVNTWGWYYNPYSVYSSPSMYLTDYLLSNAVYASIAANNVANAEADANAMAAQNAQAAQSASYSAEQAQAAAQQAQQSAQQTQGAITQEIKDQVKVQVEAEVKAHEKNEIVPLDQSLQDPKHVFVLTDDVSATAINPDGTDGDECSLTAGDVVGINTTALGSVKPGVDADSSTVSLVVKSSKYSAKNNADECKAKTVFQKSLTDAQEMENAFAKGVDKGMKDLQAKQGQKGIPAAPAQAIGTTENKIAGVDEEATAKEAQQQLQAQDQAAKDVENDSDAQIVADQSQPDADDAPVQSNTQANNPPTKKSGWN